MNKTIVKEKISGALRAVSLTRFSIKEQTLFAKRMSFLIKAGVPILECLHVIRKQTKSKSKVRIFDVIIDDVANGQYLATSLGKFNNLFGDFTVNLIRVGESSGVLSQNLAYLADELTKKDALRRKVVGALIYPIFITVATLGVTSLLTVFIFPKLMPIFTSLHVKLPWTTRALIAVSEFLRTSWLYLIIGIILAIVSFIVVRKISKRARFFVDRILLYTPLVGSIMQGYNLTNFCRTLGLLLRSGIHLSEAMVITAETTKNLVYRNVYMDIAGSIVKGETISQTMAERTDIFPDMLAHMVGIGERTGNLSGTFVYLSELYESEVDELTKGLSSSIEPILMTVMGILVGLIAVSVITPIYEITQHLQPK